MLPSAAQSTLQRPWMPGLRARVSPKLAWSAGSLFASLAAWELVAWQGWIDPRYISRPSAVLKAGYELVASGSLWIHLGVTLAELLAGFVAGCMVGLAMGIPMGRSRLASGLLDPVIMALYVTPKVALIPLAVVWFGVDMGSKVFVVFLDVMFPVLVNAMAGIRSVNPLWARVARSFCATEWQVFRKVLLPGSLPAVATGIRLGFGRGVVGVVLAEMYVSRYGLGNLIVTMGSAAKTDELLFLIALVSGVGYAGAALLRQLTRRAAAWEPEV